MYAWDRALDPAELAIAKDGFDQQPVAGLLAFFGLENVNSSLVLDRTGAHGYAALIGAPAWALDGPARGSWRQLGVEVRSPTLLLTAASTAVLGYV